MGGSCTIAQAARFGSRVRRVKRDDIPRFRRRSSKIRRVRRFTPGNESQTPAGIPIGAKVDSQGILRTPGSPAKRRLTWSLSNSC